MFDVLKKKLEALGAAGWELTETEKRGWEFYFIRHQLDQNRVVETRTYSVKIYRSIEDGKYLGSASDVISPTMNDEEIDRRIASVWEQAALIRNPMYKLVSEPINIPDKNNPVDLEKISRDFIETFAGIAETSGEDINSYEIFVSSLSRRFLNSNGVAYSCVYPSSTIDLVVNARREGHEIELFRFITCGTCDREKLRKDVEDALRFGKDRLVAKNTPKLQSGAVVFSTADACEIYDYFLYQMNASLKIRKISSYEIGQPICDKFEGDILSVKAVSSLPNSSQDYPVDGEGSVIEDRYLIRDGIPENFYGTRQFAQYLGLEKSSNVQNAVFSGGKGDAASVRSGDYLEVVDFSDFQVDPMSGDIAGEIRLGYLCRGGKITPVTGGSISGSLPAAVSTMRFSKESVQYDTLMIPAVTRLENLRITGIAELED